MLVDKLVTYKALDLKKFPIPTRSHLYCLEPIGVGTPYVESLTGYVQRLAEAHCVPTGTLMVSKIAPLTKKEYVFTGKEQDIAVIFGSQPALNGTSATATACVQALETLTLCNNLSFLTMLTWAEVVSPRSLLRGVQAWCPLCYKEWQESRKVIYQPLIWALRLVMVCPRHPQQVLQTCCPNCRQQLRWLAWRSQPGYCSKCRGWLGITPEPQNISTSKILTDEELKYQLWIIANLGELIANAPFVSAPPRRERIKQFISRCIDQTPTGKITTFARLLKIDGSTVNLWYLGRTIPQLNNLLEVCALLNISLLDCLCQEVSTLKLTELVTEVVNSQQPKTENSPGRYYELKQLQQALLEALNESPVPTLKNVAKRIGCQVTMLRKRCPDLCRDLSKQRTDDRNLRLEQCRSTLLLLLEKDVFQPLSLTEVSRQIGMSESTLRNYFPDLCFAISKQYMDFQAIGRKQWQEQLYQQIQQIALKLHAEGVKPGSNQIAKYLTKPGVLRNKVAFAALRDIRHELGYE